VTMSTTTRLCRWMSNNKSSNNNSGESKSTFGPLQYGMIGLLAAGMIGATLFETKTAKELGLKRSMTQTYDMTRRKTGEFTSTAAASSATTSPTTGRK